MKVALDIGGTFTDVLAVDDHGIVSSTKLRTDPTDLSACFCSALKTILSQGESTAQQPDTLLYGTTFALNALLTHELPAIGLILNRGFRELLETARLPRSEESGGTESELPPRLVPLEWVSEVGARIEADGSVRCPVDGAEVKALAHHYRDRGIATVAVSLLHSYRDASHELEITEIFARETPSIEVVRSSEVLPELREYERTLATCLNACLVQVMKGHIEEITGESSASALWMMKSSGGLSSAAAVAQKPLATALSGPAAAVIGGAWLGRQIGIENLISLDIGGTSTDVALVRAGRYSLTTQGEVAGFSWKTPMIDVFTIGAGGGSLATAGADGRWRIGPESAGALPGPVCYGQGGRGVTLCDAQLVLGRLPATLLGGELALDGDASRRALTEFGATRKLDAERAARGLLEIATHQICGAIRRVSVLRGHDPKNYALFAIGGAGPLHAAEVAALLGMGRVVVPPKPGLAAAYGLMVADLREDFVRAFGQMENGVDAKHAEEMFVALECEAENFFDAQSIELAGHATHRSIDMRYEGMLYETSIALPSGVITPRRLSQAVDAFHDHFEALSGHSHRGSEAVELVNLRVTVIGERRKAALVGAIAVATDSPVPRARRRVGFLHERNLLESEVYDRDSLGAGAMLRGPAVIEEAESTIIVPPAFDASVDDFGNVILQPAAAP